MKNFEKYKTAECRIKTFYSFVCHKQECEVMMKYKNSSNRVLHCYDCWLDIEADEVKPLPCPFCGSDMFVSRTFMHCTRTNAKWCGYSITWGGKHGDKYKVIAAHNRVCEAVAAYKGSEVKS